MYANGPRHANCAREKEYLKRAILCSISAWAWLGCAFPDSFFSISIRAHWYEHKLSSRIAIRRRDIDIDSWHLTDALPSQRCSSQATCYKPFIVEELGGPEIKMCDIR